jgi:lysozyme family protein
MKDNYERTVKFIMDKEGAEITNTKNDRGGLTAAYGLTLSTMKTLHLDLDHDGDVDGEDVKLVNKDVIDKAFHRYFWDRIRGDKLPGGIDLILADVAWNSGAGKTMQFIQEGFGDDIERLTARRIRFYEYQAANVPGQKEFLTGWKNRAHDALREAGKCFK